ncbi:MAG TPA: hypothetical protein PKU91_11190, partial [Phycisphaerales bacterium]|nr:hypothetical protein [Phycisphaerales bacterium]
MAADARDATLAPIAADLVADAHTNVADTAERALITLALGASRECLGSTVLTPDDDLIPADVRSSLDLGVRGTTDALAAAVAHAAAGYPAHQRRGVIMAAMILLTPGLMAR